MNKESYQPDYGPTEYDLDFTFELDFSMSDYLMIGAYFVFIVPVFLVMGLVTAVYRGIRNIFRRADETTEEQLSSPGLLSFVSKIF